MVGCRSAVQRDKLKMGVRVSLDMTTLTIMRYVALRIHGPESLRPDQ